MADIEIPNPASRRWTGPYIGSYRGVLWRTFNVDLENNPGHVTLSRSFSAAADTTDSEASNLLVTDAFLRTDADNTERWWALQRGGRLLKTYGADPLQPSSKYEQDSLANSPVDARDMAIHENDSDSAGGQNVLMVTRDTDIAVLNDTAANTWNANWWVSTKGQIGLKSGVPHPAEYFPLVRITMVGDGNLIHTIDKSKACSYARLIFPPYYQVESIFVTAYRAWILLSGKFGRNGGIAEWDGYSESYLHIYDAQSINVFAGVNFNEIPIVVNSRGQVLEYNGTGFQLMVRNGEQIAFPVYAEVGNAFGIATSQISISPRGMTLSDDGLVYINAKEPAVNSQRQLGGVWCLNPDNGSLYSKFSLGHGGDTDFGQQIVNAPGAIKAIGYYVSSGGTSPSLVAGANVEQAGAGGNRNKIWVLPRSASSTSRRGFFVTQFFLTSNIKDTYDTIWAKFSSFKSANDRIVVKARGVNPMLDANKQPIQKTITWTSGSTFTVTLAAGDDALAAGDEVEVVGGYNAGVLAHITGFTGSHAALQTVTIDETVTVLSGTSYARFDRWKKVGVIDDATKYAVPLKVGITSSFIQFKVEIRGPATDFDIKSLIAHVTAQTITQK